MSENLAMLQLQALAVLMFDEKHAKLIRHRLEAGNWQGDIAIKTLVRDLYLYVDSYGKAPGSNHLPSLLQDLKVSDEQRSNLIDVVGRCLDMYEAGLNIEYLTNQLDRFQVINTWLPVVERGMVLLPAGNDQEFMALKAAAEKTTVKAYDPGSTVIEVLERQANMTAQELENSFLPLGIPALDDRNIHPIRGGLFLFIAHSGKGKSWFMVHAGRLAILHGLKVLYITLEMNEDAVGTRYAQMVYKYCTHKPGIKTHYSIEPGGFNQLPDPQYKILKDHLPEAIDQAKKDEQMWSNLKIKQFPTGRVTLDTIKGYLDSMEIMDNFIPDVLILDYAELLQRRASKESWAEIEQLYRDVRGLAVERNLMAITASQPRRGDGDRSEIYNVDISASYGKISISDFVVTYNQTDVESDLGLARLRVTKNRNGEDGFEVVISQNYNLGQFMVPARQGSGVLDLSKPEEEDIHRNFVTPIEGEKKKK